MGRGGSKKEGNSKIIFKGSSQRNTWGGENLRNKGQILILSMKTTVIEGEGKKDSWTSGAGCKGKPNGE